MADSDVLRQKLKQKDEQIEALEAKVAAQEQELQQAKRAQAGAESKLARALQANLELEAQVAKLKETERDLLTKQQQLKKMVTAASANNGSFAANGNSTPSTPALAPAKAVVPQVAAPPPSAPAPATPSKAAPAGLDYYWGATAKVILTSYDYRLMVMSDELTERSKLQAMHVRMLTESLVVFKERAESLSRSSMTSQKLAMLDEEKRLEQFKELTNLRESLIVLEREKAVLAREVTSLDATVAELEEHLRAVEREKKAADMARQEMQEKLEAQTRRLVDAACNPNNESTLSAVYGNGPAVAASLTKQDIMGNSDLKAEVLRLSSELKQAKREASHATEKLNKIQQKHSSSSQTLKIMVDEGLASREALLAGRRLREESAEREADQLRAELGYSTTKMQRRIAELEHTLNMKESQLQQLSLAAKRKKQQQLYVDASLVLQDPYSKGLVRAVSPGKSTGKGTGRRGGLESSALSFEQETTVRAYQRPFAV